MKYLIASDIHGSYSRANDLKNAFIKEGADKLILLGDIYNHGPRNPLPDNYAPLKVAEVLNSVKENLIVLKGNCDSEVDTYISEFDFIDSIVLVAGNKTVFLSHGNVYNIDAMPKTKFDIVGYGHFHTAFIKKVGEAIIFNPGSVALPKDNFTGYAVLTDTDLTLKSFDGRVLDSVKL